MWFPKKKKAFKTNFMACLVAKIAPDCTDLHLDLKNFRGGMPPDSPRVCLQLWGSAPLAPFAQAALRHRLRQKISWFLKKFLMHPCISFKRWYFISFRGRDNWAPPEDPGGNSGQWVGCGHPPLAVGHAALSASLDLLLSRCLGLRLLLDFIKFKANPYWLVKVSSLCRITMHVLLRREVRNLSQGNSIAFTIRSLTQRLGIRKKMIKELLR